MTQTQSEDREAVRDEVMPVLRLAGEVTRNRSLERAMVSSRSTVGHLLWNDKDGKQLKDLSDLVGFAVTYADTLISVARRLRKG